MTRMVKGSVKYSMVHPYGMVVLPNPSPNKLFQRLINLIL